MARPLAWPAIPSGARAGRLSISAARGLTGGLAELSSVRISVICSIYERRSEPSRSVVPPPARQCGELSVMLDQPAREPVLAWPAEGVTRVPYWVFQREDVYRREQKLLFQGPYWHFLCLGVEIPEPGDFCTTFVGETPVIVVRDHDGE